MVSSEANVARKVVVASYHDCSLSALLQILAVTQAADNSKVFPHSLRSSFFSNLATLIQSQQAYLRLPVYFRET